jgi:hypothetical protein
MQRSQCAQINLYGRKQLNHGGTEITEKKEIREKQVAIRRVPLALPVPAEP